MLKPQNGSKQRHTVLGAGEHRRRLRGVFGIPHAAVKINNQLFLDHSEVKTGGNLNYRERFFFFALLKAEGEEQ